MGGHAGKRWLRELQLYLLLQSLFFAIMSAKHKSPSRFIPNLRTKRTRASDHPTDLEKNSSRRGDAIFRPHPIPTQAQAVRKGRKLLGESDSNLAQGHRAREHRIHQMLPGYCSSEC